MKRLFPLTFLLAVLSQAYAGTDFSYALRVKGYAALNGIDQSEFNYETGRLKLSANGDGTGHVKWGIAEVPAPTDATLPTVEDAEIAIAAQAAAKEVARQAAKTLEQKTLENQFYTLISQALLAANDPRKDDVLVPKLGFPEITALIEVIEVGDAMAAVKLSLRLLTIDAALKRFTPLWWEDAIVHDLGE